jgi:hypothetical protein
MAATVRPGLKVRLDEMRILRLIWRAWLGLGSLLGWINTRIILLLVFLLLVTPIALVGRLRGRSQRGRWHDVEKRSDTPEDFRRLY